MRTPSGSYLSVRRTRTYPAAALRTYVSGQLRRLLRPLPQARKATLILRVHVGGNMQLARRHRIASGPAVLRAGGSRRALRTDAARSAGRRRRVNQGKILQGEDRSGVGFGGIKELSVASFSHCLVNGGSGFYQCVHGGGVYEFGAQLTQSDGGQRRR